ncbi:hypothetical protein OROMI_000818 [Orobanche minor]
MGGHVLGFPRSDSSAGLYSLSSSTSVCWLASTNAGPSGGFYYLSSVPPDALVQKRQCIWFGGTTHQRKVSVFMECGSAKSRLK